MILHLEIPDDVRLGSIQFRSWNEAWTVFLYATDPKLEPHIHGFGTKYSIEEALDAAIIDFREKAAERERYLASDEYRERLAAAPKGIRRDAASSIQPPDKLADLF